MAEEKKLNYFELPYKIYSKQFVFRIPAGTMTVGFRNTNNIDSAVLGKLSGLNIWSYPVSIKEILRMSYGCGTEAGDSKSWETVRDEITEEVEVKDSRTCKERRGKCSVMSRNYL